MTIAETDARSDRPGQAAGRDVVLIDRIAARDARALEALYRDYYPRLHRFLGRVTQRTQVVDEVVNDTMLVVWRKAPGLDLRSKVSTWIFGIALRRAFKALKRVDEPVDFEADEQPDSGMESPEGALFRREQNDALSRALRKLTPEHRAVIELTYFLGHSCAEIAQIMDCPVNTVKTRMFHARRRLRMELPEDLGSDE